LNISVGHPSASGHIIPPYLRQQVVAGDCYWEK